MRNKTKIIRAIMIFLLVSLFVSCTDTSDPVTRQLNKLENVIDKYEKRAIKSKLTEADTEKMQAELLSIGIAAPDDIAPAQEQSFSKLVIVWPAWKHLHRRNKMIFLQEEINI